MASAYYPPRFEDVEPQEFDPLIGPEPQLVETDEERRRREEEERRRAANPWRNAPDPAPMPRSSEPAQQGVQPIPYAAPDGPPSIPPAMTDEQLAARRLQAPQRSDWEEYQRQQLKGARYYGFDPAWEAEQQRRGEASKQQFFEAGQQRQAAANRQSDAFYGNPPPSAAPMFQVTDASWAAQGRGNRGGQALPGFGPNAPQFQLPPVFTHADAVRTTQLINGITLVQQDKTINDDERNVILGSMVQGLTFLEAKKQAATVRKQKEEEESLVRQTALTQGVMLKNARTEQLVMMNAPGSHIWLNPKTGEPEFQWNPFKKEWENPKLKGAVDHDVKDFETRHAAWLRHITTYDSAFRKERAAVEKENRERVAKQGDPDITYRPATDDELDAAAARRVKIKPPGEEPVPPQRDRQQQAAPPQTMGGPAPQAPQQPPPPQAAPIPVEAYIGRLNQQRREYVGRPDLPQAVKHEVNAALEQVGKLVAMAGGVDRLTGPDKIMYERLKERVRQLTAPPAAPQNIFPQDSSE